MIRRKQPWFAVYRRTNWCYWFELFLLFFFLIGKTIFLKSAVAHSLFLMHCDRCWLGCRVASGELTFKAYIPQSFHTYSEFKLQWAEWLLYITQSDFERRRELCLMNCSKSRLGAEHDACQKGAIRAAAVPQHTLSRRIKRAWKESPGFRNWATLPEMKSAHLAMFYTCRPQKILNASWVT